MCPYCAVRGRQASGGRPRYLKSAAAKIPQTGERRACLAIHVAHRPTGGDAGNLRCTQPTAPAAELSICEIRRSSRELVGPKRWPRLRGPTKRAAATAAGHWVRPLCGRPTEYTGSSGLETTSYAEDPVPEHDPRAIRTEVRHSEVAESDSGQRLDNYLHRLLPDLPRERYHYLGNSSLMGACKTLVSRRSREQQHELCTRMTYLELNTNPAYMHQYTGALFLPHTDIDRFPSVKNRR